MSPLLPHLTPVLHHSLALHSHLPRCSHCGLLAFNTLTHQPSTQHNLQQSSTHQPSTQPSTYQYTNLNTTWLSTAFNTLTHQHSTQHNLQHTNTATFNTTFNIPTFNTTQLSTTFNTQTHQPSTQCNLQHNLQHNLQQPNTPAFNTTQPVTFNTTFSCLQHTNTALPRGSSQPFPLLQQSIPRHPYLLQVFAWLSCSPGGLLWPLYSSYLPGYFIFLLRFFSLFSMSFNVAIIYLLCLLFNIDPLH